MISIINYCCRLIVPTVSLNLAVNLVIYETPLPSSVTHASGVQVLASHPRSCANYYIGLVCVASPRHQGATLDILSIGSSTQHVPADACIYLVVAYVALLLCD